MTLGFSTDWPKNMPDHMAAKPTFFVEKIWEGIFQKGIQINANDFIEYGRKNLPKNYIVGTKIPKVHTLRQDSKDKWKLGMKIHPVINNRTKNRFQFAPELEVKGIQKIEISYHTINNWDGSIKSENSPLIRIDGRVLCGLEAITLSQNDGFESLEQFLAWFKEDFTGKIIHWTDLKY